MADAFSDAFSFLKGSLLDKSMGGAGGISVCPQCGVKAGKWGGKPCDECEAKPLAEGAEVSQANEPPQKPMMNKAFSFLKAHPARKKQLADMQAGKREHAQRRMQTGPTEDPNDEFQYDTEDGSKKPIGEDEDTGYDMRTTEERELKMRKSAFDLAMKALNPAQQDDPDGPLSERRHNRNIGRQMRIYDSGKDFGAIGSRNAFHPSQLPDLRMPPMPMPQSSGQRNSNTTGTFPPNPPPQHPMAVSPNTQEMPRNIEQQARPLSESNPYGRIKESELQRLADDYGIPLTKSWMFLKEEADMAALQAENNSLKARIDYLQGMIRILQQQRDEGLVGGD